MRERGRNGQANYYEEEFENPEETEDNSFIAKVLAVVVSASFFYTDILA